MKILERPNSNHGSGFNVSLTIVAFGMLLLWFVWSAVYSHLATEHDTELRAAQRDVANVARLAEEHALQVLREADRTLSAIVNQYRESGGKFDVSSFARDRLAQSGTHGEIGIINEHGMLASSGLPSSNVNPAGYEYFQTHVARDSRQTFISKPEAGLAPGRFTLHLSRRLNKADSAFGGVVFMSIDPAHFIAFYEDIHLRKGTVISITGNDGVVRVSAPVATDPEPALDTARIISSRPIRDYPLVVSVGISQEAALSDYRHERAYYLIAGAVVSVMIIVFLFFLLMASRRSQTIAHALSMSNAELRRVVESNERLAAIIESSADAIYSRTLDGTVLSWNRGAQNLFGWSAAEIVGHSMDMLIPPDCRQVGTLKASTLAEQGTICAYDTVNMHRDGHRIDVSTRLSLIHGASSGEVSGISVVTRDITARKRAERALQELRSTLELKVNERTVALHAANENLKSFAYSVSHDLRAPLRAIDGFARILDENTADLDAENRSRIKRIRGSARRMSELIDSLLLFSRLDQVQVEMQSHDVKLMVCDVAAEVNSEFPNVKFDVGDLGYSHGDPALLRQVWANLLGNAAKFSGKTANPYVEIRCIEQAGERVFRIRDNGAGFDMQYAGRLFELFQRMHRQEEFPGTGAGLAIVKRIVERHRGRVWAESAPGKGASFYFTLGVDLAASQGAVESGWSIPSVSAPMRGGDGVKVSLVAEPEHV